MDLRSSAESIDRFDPATNSGPTIPGSFRRSTSRSSRGASTSPRHRRQRPRRGARSRASPFPGGAVLDAARPSVKSVVECSPPRPFATPSSPRPTTPARPPAFGRADRPSLSPRRGPPDHQVPRHQRLRHLGAGRRVWVGSNGLLVRLSLQTIGSAADLTVPLPPSSAISPGTTHQTARPDVCPIAAPRPISGRRPLPRTLPRSFARPSDVLRGAGRDGLPARHRSRPSPPTRPAVRPDPAAGDDGDGDRSRRLRPHGAHPGRRLVLGASFPAQAQADVLGAGASRTLFTGARAGTTAVLGLYAPVGGHGALAHAGGARRNRPRHAGCESGLQLGPGVQPARVRLRRFRPSPATPCGSRWSPAPSSPTSTSWTREVRPGVVAPVAATTRPLIPTCGRCHGLRRRRLRHRPAPLQSRRVPRGQRHDLVRSPRWIRAAASGDPDPRAE